MSRNAAERRASFQNRIESPGSRLAICAGIDWVTAGGAGGAVATVS